MIIVKKYSNLFIGMNLQDIGYYKWRFDISTIFFSIISLVLFNLAVFIPEQRILILSFFTISIIFAIISFYLQKVNYVGKSIKVTQQNIKNLYNETIERFNYLQEIYNIKKDIEMLKRKDKRAQINLIDLIKIIVAVILIYVIIQIIKNLG